MVDHLIYLFAWPIPAWEKFVHGYISFGPGVDVFFVISGFVIARGLLPRLRSAQTPMAFVDEVRIFWIRRVWRLIPSAWLWVGIVLLASVVFNRTGTFQSFYINFESSVADILALANFRISISFPYYGATIHYWSLSLEEQFYILFPVVVWFAGRRLVPVLFIFSAILAALPFNVWVASFRAEGVAFGVLLAIFVEQPLHRLLAPQSLAHSRVARVATLFGILVLIGSMAPTNQSILPYHRIVVIQLLASVLVFIASFGRNYLWQPGVSQRVMLWVGSRSYAIYLCHLPIYTGVREFWFRVFPAGRVAGQGDEMRFLLTALPLVFIVAELNYRFVEKPLRDRGRRIAAQQPSWEQAVRSGMNP